MSEIITGLAEDFSRVQKLLSKYQLWRYRKFGPSGDPHRGQGRVLALLKLQPEISQKEMGFLLDMRNQSLGELLTKLEKIGAVVRFPSDEDHRVMNIKLTESGTKLVANTTKKQDDISEVFECLSTGDQNKLHEILNLLSDELENRLAQDDDGKSNKKEKEKGNSHHRNGEAKAAPQNQDNIEKIHECRLERETSKELEA